LNKRLYFPLRDSEGHEVIAIVRVAADPVGFEELRRKGRNVLLGFIVSNVVLVVLYVMTMRLVRRTIEAERLAAQADRLRALGTMTAGIAHEIRNPLGIISLQVEEMRAFLPQIPEEKTRAAFDEIAHDLQAETKRLRELTESFLHFSKASSSTSFQPVSVRVDKILEPLLKIWTKGLNPELRKISYRNPDPDARVLFTEDRLRQVVLNLLRNADEAMGSRQGSIEITVRTGGNYVDIVIQDTGPGIPKENIEQIFDPFFTTRVEGTGLGLPLSRAMARSAKGDILVESEPGKGSTFTLRLHGR
jgi:signal transduction histidine kinase